MKWKTFGRWGMLFLLICAVVAVSAWFFRRSENPPPEVKITRPAYTDIANLVTTDGMVEPLREFQAHANFPGMVDKVPVELGDKVAAGQLLVTMKDPYAVSRVATAASAVSFASRDEEDMHRGGTQEERIQLANDLAHAQAAQGNATANLDTVERLQQQGAASAAEVNGAKARLTDATTTLDALQQRSARRFSPAAVNAAQARLSDTKAALGAAKMSFDNANIASPMAGTVYSVTVAPYDFVNLGADLLRVADLSQMQVRAHFDEPEVGKLKAGQNVTITWEGRPGMIWHGHIRQAPVAAMPMGVRSVAECLIKVDDASGDLLPNTHVIVTVPIEQRTHVLTVPREALQTDGPRTYLFRVVDDKLVRTPVIIGITNLDLVEIVQGVTPQDVVAVRAINHQTLNNKQAIIPVE